MSSLSYEARLLLLLIRRALEPWQSQGNVIDLELGRSDCGLDSAGWLRLPSGATAEMESAAELLRAAGFQAQCHPGGSGLGVPEVPRVQVLRGTVAFVCPYCMGVGRAINPKTKLSRKCVYCKGRKPEERE